VLLSIAGLAAFAGLFLWRCLSLEDPKNYGFASADLLLYYYPVYEQIYARVRAGVLPRWNPWQLCGTPWLAALQSGLYYPGHLLYVVLSTHLGMAISGTAHLLLAAIGTYAFTRRTGLGHLGALTAGLVFGFRGNLAYCLNGPNLQEAAAWIGVGACGVVMLAEDRNARAAAILATATAMSLLAGYPQHTVYLLYTWAALWLTWMIALHPRPHIVAGSGVLFGSALALGVLVAAAQLLPTAEVVRVGGRGVAELPKEAVSPLGNYAATVLLQNPVVGSVYSFGVMPLVLAGLATLGGRHRALARWALLLGLIAAVFALGETTRWFWIYRALPGLEMFRGPDRMLLITDFAVAVAAGVALDALVRGRDDSRRRWSRLALDVAPALAAAGLACSYVAQGTPRASAVVVGLGLGATALFLMGGRRIATVTAVLVLGLVATEILATTDLKLVLPYTAKRVQLIEGYDAAYQELAGRDPHDRSWVLRSLDPRLAAKQATRHRFRSMEDYEPVNLGRQNQYLTFLSQGVITDFVGGLTFVGSVPSGMHAGANGTSPGTRRRLLDLAAVNRIVMTADMVARPQVHEFLTAAELGTGLQARGPFVVIPNPNALPRAYVVYRTTPAPPVGRLLPLLADAAFDPLALAYVEGNPGFVPAVDAPPRGQAARFIEDGEDVVEIETIAAVAGLLVLSDTYVTGWRATVDGAPAAIVPTNHLFRGVPIPAGTHRVRFTYRPWTIPAGQMLSLVGLVILGLLFRARSTAARGVEREPSSAIPDCRRSTRVGITH
jgi:hypothetical protein